MQEGRKKPFSLDRRGEGGSLDADGCGIEFGASKKGKKGEEGGISVHPRLEKRGGAVHCGRVG